MKKLLKWHDSYTLKILVSFLILFTALYPKLPSVHIMRTWVYIRLEDFFILGTVLVWMIQLLRKKVALPLFLASPIMLYWLVGFISVIFSIIFIAPNLTGFFPHVAILSFLRRIEYMVLFFVALSTIRTKDDVRDYFVTLSIAIAAVFLYGLGQRYYIFLWQANSAFFQKNPFCFPSFQTGNEEFAKGLPLCLPAGARITSTFGGSYDLAAYLALALPVIIGCLFAVKKWLWRIITGIVFLAGLILLIFTAQRAAFIAYIIGSIFTLVLIRKKLFIILLLIISVGFLLIFSESTAKRFLATFRVSSVVVDSQGKLIGEQLPENLKNKIEKPKGGQNLPQGSAFLGLPSQGNLSATNSAMIKKTLTPQEAKRLQLAEGTLQISTVTGTFLVRKVLVYDISFTTRFQAEWPNAWRAFLRNPLLGSGYSSITLATDNDYFRALGETGIFGLLSFMGIFLIFWIALKKLAAGVKSPLIRGFAYGLAGGVAGLALNATLIDVFEASKVAENLWILLGIGMGGLLLTRTKPIAYKKELEKILTSTKALITYLFFITFGVFFTSISNFFVADDFTWLKWAATANITDLPGYFINSQNFFYRPLDKIINYFLYTLFSFQPTGYHVFILLLHFLSVLAVFNITKIILKNRNLAFFTALLFALVPAHSENILWFSGLSGILASTLILYAVICFIRFRQNNSKSSYLLAFTLSVLANMSYEIAVAIPLIFIVIDIFATNQKLNRKTLFSYIPFFALIPIYYLMRVITHAFAGGGDYSYSLTNFIPNVTGNFFGYIGLFLFNDHFLPFYNALRNSLRGNKLIVLLMVLIAALLLVAIYGMRNKIAKTLQDKNLRLIVFGIAFAFVSLLPFLGLGNIAQRYLYLASFGLCFSLVIILRQILNKKYLLLIGVLVISIWFQIQNAQAKKDWKQAGEITKHALALFRIDYEGLKSDDNVYIINTPYTYKNVWVFPVGLTDGLWFIYREHMPHVYQLNSVNEARSAIMEKGTQKNYIFQFDKNGNLLKINR